MWGGGGGGGGGDSGVEPVGGEEREEGQVRRFETVDPAVAMDAARTTEELRWDSVGGG